MAASGALAGYGAKFSIKGAGSTYTAVAEVVSITPPGLTRETIDVTHLNSDDQTKEFIGSLIEAGEATITINYVPSASDVLLTAFTTNGGAGEFRITYPKNDFNMDFKGIITGYEQGDIVVDDKLSATLTIKCSGRPTITAVSGS